MRTIEQQYARELSRMRPKDRVLVKTIAEFACLVRRVEGRDTVVVVPQHGAANQRMALALRKPH